MNDDPRSLKTALSDPFTLDGWTVHVAANRISRDGLTRKLEPRTMCVLLHLAEHRGEVVTREEVEANVWRGMVVGYDALSTAIAKLRKALDDDRQAPSVIETIPKTGYRLVASVERARIEPGERSAQTPASPERNESPEPRKAASPSGPRRVARIGLATLVLVATAVGIAYRMAPESHDGPTPAWSVDDPANAGRASIAVLPFESLDGDPEQEYFSDGMTDDLITELAQVPDLLVIARGSSFLHEHRSMELDALARELGVRYLLAGSVRRTGDRLRVNAKLFDTTSSRYLWAERYEGSLSDVFALQDEVTRAVAEALQFNVTRASRASPRDQQRVPTDAYDAYLRGWSLLQRKTPQDAARALEYFARALRLAPEYSRAHAARAQVYWEYAIDPQFIELTAPPRGGWAPGGYTHYLESWRSLRRTRARPTSQSLALSARLLQQQRRFEEAMREARRAVSLGPSDPTAHDALTEILIYAGRSHEALQRLERTVALDPSRPGEKLFLQGLAFYAQGSLHDAITALGRARLHNPLQTRYAAVQAAALAELDRITAAREALEEYLSGWSSFTSLDWIMFHWPFQSPELLERFSAGLVKAGMDAPGEKSLRVLPENRLHSAELEGLLANRTMIAIDRSYYGQVPFEVVWDGRPGVVEQGQLPYFKDGAVARAENDLLCVHWRDLDDYCVAVYRNQGGTAQSRDEHLFYTLTGLFSFSVR